MLSKTQLIEIIDPRYPAWFGKSALSLMMISLFAFPAQASLIYTTEGNVISSDTNVNGYIQISSPNHASLEINNGATVHLRVGNLVGQVAIGVYNGDTGALTVSGQGTRLLAYNIFHVGANQAKGKLIVKDGAYVQTTSMGSLRIGGDPGGEGEAIVTGVGSTFYSEGEIAVGFQTKGSLAVLDGGVVNLGAKMYIGRGNMSVANSPSASGAVVVSGVGSTINATNGVYVGTYGDGFMLISDGGQVISSAVENSYVALDNAANASEAIVTGGGSLWQTQGKLIIGGKGKGTLTVNDGGEISAAGITLGESASGKGQLIIGAAAGQTAVGAGNITTNVINFGAGSGNITFNHTGDSYDFSSSIQGNGSVDLYHGTTIMSGASSYTGATTVHGGTLAAGANSAFSINSHYDVKNGATVNLNGYDQAVGKLTNGGTVDFNGHVGSVLTVNGDYIGNDGAILFNGSLSDDLSATNKLVINGDSAGNSFVSVHNIGGLGDQTLNGIELIHVANQSNGEFVQNGRIVAGAYEYTLARGEGSNSNHWYLTSRLSPNDDGQVRRPEAGSYNANLAGANGLFVMRLHDRLGETQYIDPISGEQKVTSLWLRNEGGHTRSKDGSGQLKTTANRYVVQLGGDIAQWSSDQTDRWNLGAMAGYGRSDNKTRSSVSGSDSKGTVDGYSVGLYATWYADNDNRTGAYADSWLQYGWFDNSVEGKGQTSEHYDSSGITASLESGYTFDWRDDWYIQPKAQLIWMGIKADDHIESNGTRVSGEGDGNIQTRLGVRLFNKNDADKYQLFGEANWLYNSKMFSTTLDDATVKEDGSRHIAELKIGAEGKLNQNLHLWGNVAQQIGSKSYSDTSATVGAKIVF
jgi:autotransporter family porin